MDSPENLVILLPPQPPLTFIPEVMGICLPSAEPWAVRSGLWLGLLTPKVSLPVFIHHTWMWDHPFCSHFCLSVPHHVSAPLHHVSVTLPLPTHLDKCGYFYSLVVRLPYSSIFWWFLLFVLTYSCNSLYGCVRKLSMSTYAFILIRRFPVPFLFSLFGSYSFLLHSFIY